jgi:hypothetical protein
LKPNTIAKFILLSFSSVILLGTFQNCAQSTGATAFTPSTSGAGNNNSNTSSMDKIDNVDLSAADFIDVSLRSLYAEENVQRRSVKDFQNLKINLANGEMRYVDTEGNVLNSTRLCLHRKELEEFKSILQQSRVCQPVLPANREDLACTQVYKFPFAWLQYANGDKIKLGEISGCSRSLDLCEEHRDIFNGFIAYLRNHLDSRKCL